MCIRDSTTEILPASNPDSIRQAKRLLSKGQLVAIPTETVYGLAANAFSEEAVAGIFAVKGRPSNNPLIVHVSSVKMARDCISAWPEEANRKLISNIVNYHFAPTKNAKINLIKKCEDGSDISDQSVVECRYENKVWIPVEATLVGKPFFSAWKQGALKYSQMKADQFVNEINMTKAMAKAVAMAGGMAMRAGPGGRPWWPALVAGHGLATLQAGSGGAGGAEAVLGAVYTPMAAEDPPESKTGMAGRNRVAELGSGAAVSEDSLWGVEKSAGVYPHPPLFIDLSLIHI